MPKHLLLVAGNIGAGKTTLTERIATRLGWEAGFETVATNPFLPDFYADMRSWSFHLQVYFLGDRADLHRRLAAAPRSAIIDRSIYEDAHIFARALREMGNMTERDYLAYRRVYDLVVEGLPRPDLLIYLDAPVSVLMERIQARARDMETGISADYLSLLDSYYREWLAGFDWCPALTVPADNLNFVTNERHIDIIVDRIQQKLAGHEHVVFPDDL
jgi:deoxyadenosine/deoxycytidine kinase